MERDFSDKIGHNITFYLDKDGSVTISDFPAEFKELVIKLLRGEKSNQK